MGNPMGVLQMQKLGGRVCVAGAGYSQVAQGLAWAETQVLSGL